MKCIHTVHGEQIVVQPIKPSRAAPLARGFVLRHTNPDEHRPVLTIGHSRYEIQFRGHEFSLFPCSRSNYLLDSQDMLQRRMNPCKRLQYFTGGGRSGAAPTDVG